MYNQHYLWTLSSSLLIGCRRSVTDHFVGRCILHTTVDVDTGIFKHHSVAALGILLGIATFVLSVVTAKSFVVISALLRPHSCLIFCSTSRPDCRYRPVLGASATCFSAKLAWLGPSIGSWRWPLTWILLKKVLCQTSTTVIMTLLLSTNVALKPKPTQGITSHHSKWRRKDGTRNQIPIMGLCPIIRSNGVTAQEPVG